MAGSTIFSGGSVLLKPLIHRGLSHWSAKPIVFLVWSLPIIWLVYAAFQDLLGANPAEALIRSLGDWTLRALVAVLVVTPLRLASGWQALARFRRMLGVFVFAYATLHLMAYLWFDMGWDWTETLADIRKRPFILVGFLGWAILLSLAATSFNRAIRWMGAARWKVLHRGVFACVVLALLHFFWMRAGKHNFVEVAWYAAIFAALIGWRLKRWWLARRAAGH